MVSQMLSIVIPVYRNQESLADLLATLSTLAHELRVSAGQTLEAVFVVDGSPDDSFALLNSQLPTASFASKLILHSRNFGSFAAIRTGLTAAAGEHFAVMAADLQEPPGLMALFFKALLADECDVVVGCREKRDDAYLSRLASSIFWRFYRAFVMREFPENGVDIFGCNRQFRDELIRLSEANSSLIGLIFWLGYRRKEIFYHRQKRAHGRSAWTLAKKLNYLRDSVFSFTDLPIRLLSAFGLIGVLGSTILGLIVVIAKIFGKIDVPGYAATILTIIFFGGINAVGLGIVGAYAWRGFENTKQRPLALVRMCRSFDGSQKGE